MANEPSEATLHQLRAIFRTGSPASRTDPQLLDRYLSDDPDAAEAAFAALVERHGPMVLGCCRAVLGDPDDAEDALQATFLVLARRARSIRDPASLAGWLARVAHRVASKARARLARRRSREREAVDRRAARTIAAPPESYAELYEEIDRLPGKFRGPVVLCDLEGLSYEQAAGQLLVPVGTVRSRLARARGRLGARLRRRGLAPGLAGVAADLGIRPTSVALSAATTRAIARAAIDLAAGRSLAGAVSAGAVGLMTAYLRSQAMARIGIIALILVSAGLAAVGASRLANPREPATPRAGPADLTVFARVIDVQGRPAPGQEVHVLGGAEGHRVLKSDDAGNLRVVDPPTAGRRFLMLVAVPDAKTIGWASIGVGAQDLARGTAEDPLTLNLRPREDMVTGTLVDREGRPIAGAGVAVESMRNEINGPVSGYGVTFPGWPIETGTDERGRYAIPLPAGTEGSFQARHRRFAAARITFGKDLGPTGPTTLNPGGRITGVVSDATGRPVAGARLGAQALENKARANGGWCQATTDDRGRFEVGGLDPGVYNLLFLAGPEGRRRPMTASAVEAVRVRVDEDAKADLTALEGRKLRGTVVDADTGAPMPGVMVGSYGMARPRSGAACMAEHTDAEGRFELRVPPGPAYVYIMDASRIDPPSTRELVVPDDRDPEPVRLLGRATEPAERAVAKPKVVQAVKAVQPRIERKVAGEPPRPTGPVATVTGRIVDPEGHPLPGVRVYYNGDGFVDSASDREGEFILEGVPKGTIRINLDKRAYGSATVSVDADAPAGRYVLTPRADPE